MTRSPCEPTPIKATVNLSLGLGSARPQRGTKVSTPARPGTPSRAQAQVTGRVRIKLYKGNVSVIGRSSPFSLYDQDLVTFEEGQSAYDHRDAAGFIKLNALRLRVRARRDARGG